MIDDVDSFRIEIEIENNAAPGVRRELQSLLVDTGAELACFPASLLEELGIEPRNRDPSFFRANGRANAFGG